MSGEGRAGALEIDERRRQVVALLLAGVSQTDAARTLGLPVAVIAADVKTIRQQWRAERSEDLNALIQLELSRLDRLQMGHWESAIRGGVQATDACLKIIDRRIRLLGLDAPERHRVEVTNTDVVLDINERLAKLAAAHADKDKEEAAEEDEEE